MKKSIGIIGGLGPLATVKFMEIINERIANADDEIELIVINDPMTPDRTEYILDNSKPNPVINILDMVKKLDISKADVIVMPCNTASYFYKEIENNTKTPFLNIVVETCKYLKSKNIKKAGILATNGTIKSGIYKNLLEEENIDYIIPDEQEQDIVTDIIYNEVKSGKKVDMNRFNNIIKSMKNKGCEVIVLGCTELSAIKKSENLKDKSLVDAMEVLADSTIKYLNIK